MLFALSYMAANEGKFWDLWLAGWRMRFSPCIENIFETSAVFVDCRLMTYCSLAFNIDPAFGIL